MKDNLGTKLNINITFTLWVVFCFLIILAAVIGLMKWIIDGDIDVYNAITISVAFMALIVGVLTVVGVFFAYQSQREQIDLQKMEIEDGKKDIEFNRALDIIYKQLEHSTKTWTIEGINNSNVFSRDIKDCFSDLNNDNTNCIKDFLLGHFNFIPNDLYDFNEFLESFDQMLNIYKKVIDSKRLDSDQKSILTDVLEENIYRQFRPFFSNAHKLYQRYLRDIDREDTQTNINAWGDENIKLQLQYGASRIDNIIQFFLDPK
ncbi:OadG family protein [Sphingobacterium sp.]|uniref:OadG family protein n=1 Tax=Sphingobacterium sp. TaxID=341027 RepID=UPI00258D9AA5|nr:OadG family protein [Sphingobacterium sp.]WET67959.1 MAG: OadG family protein [Sphingobacterium sp.]